MAKTKYVFQVRGVYQDQEGKYGLASDDVSTTESLATYFLKLSNEVAKGNPSKYQLLVKDVMNSRNTEAKTKQVMLGRFFLEFCLRFLHFISIWYFKKNIQYKSAHYRGIQWDRNWKDYYASRRDWIGKKHISWWNC